MKTMGRRGVRYAIAALGLMASLALITPKGSFVTAETAGDAAAAVPAVEKVVDASAEEAEASGSLLDEDEEDEPAIPGATVQILTDESFERLTQVATGATTGDWFVEFYAPWCGHCRKLEGTWNDLAGKLGGQVNVGKVDVTANRGLGKRFGIKGFPTLLYFSHGDVHKFAGPRNLDALMAYAKGGFKKTESIPVPEPPSLVGGIKGIMASVVKDLKGLKGGKMPTRITFIVLTGGLLLVMLVFAIMLPSKPKPTRAKND